MAVIVTKEVLDGIKAVRDSGATNMLARDAVSELCFQMGFDEAGQWVQEHRREYAEGVFQGFDVGETAHESGKTGWQY